VNVLIGKNAQGKTNVLEAIYMLATARSWRAGRDAELVRWGTSRGRILADVERDDQGDAEIEITLSTSEKKQIAVNTIRRTRLADFLGQVNVVLIEPFDVDIVRNDPSARRRFLNLEISQIQPEYCHLMVKYRKVLEQRNGYLKDIIRRHTSDGLIDVLNEQLVIYGSRIIERRLAFIRNLANISRVIHSQITEEKEVLSVEYSSRMKLEETEGRLELIAEAFRERLRELIPAEINRGVTLAGPQRDDLLLTVNGVDARVYGSQGQQRTIALSLRIAELAIMEESAGEPPIVLLDDVMTDLDEDRRAHVFRITLGRCQTFITGASKRVFDQPFLDCAKVYDVSDGKVVLE
jgi:DNA replication and repair protein RecF